MQTTVLAVRSGTQGVVDLTDRIGSWLATIGAGDGLVSVFAPHATAGLALIEVGAGSDLDVITAIGSLLPRDDRWHHRHGSTGHGADHVMPALVSPSLVVPVLGGHMTLGTWQSVVLVDPKVDNPDRQVRCSFLS